MQYLAHLTVYSRLLINYNQIIILYVPMVKIIKFLFIGFIVYALLELLLFLMSLMFEYSDYVRDEDEPALSLLIWLKYPKILRVPLL